MAEDFFINQKGRKEVVIGGVRLLLDFSKEEIVVRIRNGTIRVVGEKLFIERFDVNEIIIHGKISAIHYE